MTGAPLTEWVGRSRTVEDVLTSAPAERLRATLDDHGADHAIEPGAALPPLWHWLYFREAAPLGELGPDGHARKGSFLPPVPLPRRMYAGGRIASHAPLRIGKPARMTSRIAGVEEKTGRSGPLVFVTVIHEVEQDGRIAVTEEQDLVFREAPAACGTPAAPQVTTTAAWTETITADPVMLFRFSAVTFNSHRIHYDRPYVTEIEGYPGLVVHGPLIAMLLLEATERRAGRDAVSYSFRAVSPLFDTEPFVLAGLAEENGETPLEARARDNRLAMTARARF